MEKTIRHISSKAIYLYIYFACLFICFNSINIKTTRPIGPNFFVVTLSQGRLLGSQILKILSRKIVNTSLFLEKHEFKQKTPQKLENEKKWRLKEQQLKVKIVIRIRSGSATNIYKTTRQYFTN